MATEFDINAPIADPLAGLSEPIDKVEETKPEVKASTDVISPSLDNRLNQIQNTVQGSELLTKILAVPGIQDLLRAHQAGQPFKVVTGDDIKPPAAVEPPPDWEKMKDDPQLLAEHLVKRITSELTPAVQKSFSQQLQPIAQKIQELDAAVSSQTSNQVSTAIDDMKKKYTDFDQMRPSMAKLNQQVGGGLSVERLYQLAKLESGQPLVGQKELETEKPTDTSARQPVATQKKQYAIGRRGMKQAIADAVGGMDLESMLSQ